MLCASPHAGLKGCPETRGTAPQGQADRRLGFGGFRPVQHSGSVLKHERNLLGRKDTLGSRPADFGRHGRLRCEENGDCLPEQLALVAERLEERNALRGRTADPQRHLKHIAADLTDTVNSTVQVGTIRAEPQGSRADTESFNNRPQRRSRRGCVCLDDRREPLREGLVAREPPFLDREDPPRDLRPHAGSTAAPLRPHEHPGHSAGKRRPRPECSLRVLGSGLHEEVDAAGADVAHEAVVGRRQLKSLGHHGAEVGRQLRRRDVVHLDRHPRPVRGAWVVGELTAPEPGGPSIAGVRLRLRREVADEAVLPGADVELRVLPLWHSFTDHSIVQ
mmetsp:Transcript_7854/g.18830  ORF Transcript_7854/g.18830 Transcript_7854/m.18830 type:complete len:334 (-) Transcript_7854:849-1850(-)